MVVSTPSLDNDRVLRRVAQRVAWLCALVLLASCARQRPYVELILDTDLPQNVALKITIRAVRLDRAFVARADAALSDSSSDSATRADASMDASVDASMDARVMDAALDARTDARSDGSGNDSASDARADGASTPFDSGTLSLDIDPSVSRQEYQRTSDGGIALPASLVFSIDPPYDDRLLIEVRAESSSSDALPSYTWTQHAIVRPASDGATIVRMVLSYHCAFPVLGCGASGTTRCNADVWCRSRGLTCGEDGVCLDPSAVSTASAPTRRPASDACAPGRCDPWCPPCPSGSTCGPNNACVRTVARGCIDNDGDGYGEGSVCLGRDCDDTRRDVSPAAAELCDRVDNDCNGMTDEQGICGPYANLSCPMATPINLMTDTSFLRLIDTAQGSMDLAPRCRFAGSSAGEGKELWYAITYPSNQELDVRLERVGAPGDPVLLAFDRCPDAMTQPLACNDDYNDATSRSARVVIRPNSTATTAKTLYFAADSYGMSSSGPMRLNVTRRAPPPAATCAAPYDVGLGGAFYGVFGAFGARDSTVLACSARTRLVDEVFVLNLPADSYAYVQASQPTRATQLFLGAGPACGMVAADQCTGSESASHELTVEGGAATVLMVEGAAAGAPYALAISATPGG